MSTELDAFLAEILPRQRDITVALHDGDARPRIALWSHNDPVTLFGAHFTGAGWADLESKFHQAALRFAGSFEFEFEVVAAGVGGDLAYTVGFEHSNAVVDGAPTTYTMRTTHIYRRERSVWRIVHRHSDFPPGSAAETPLKP